MQPRHVELEFLRKDSPTLERRFPDLVAADDELVVVSDRGEVYRGDKAFIMCLWALRRHRTRAVRLSRPAWRPLARSVFVAISANRGWISWLLGPATDEACDTGGCRS